MRKASSSVVTEDVQVLIKGCWSASTRSDVLRPQSVDAKATYVLVDGEEWLSYWLCVMILSSVSLLGFRPVLYPSLAKY
jgi:hypothetical protein